jgi:hypothetical protein
MNLKLTFLSLILFAFFAETPAQEKTGVMFLGSFHFAYPNLDRVKIEKEDQIDITSQEKQEEIVEIVNKLAEFKPDKITLEIQTWHQNKIDSLYNLYLHGKFELPVDENYQIGFRLGAMLGHKKIYCIDVWGDIEKYFDGDNKNNFSLRDSKKEMMRKLKSYSDSLLQISKSNNSYSTSNQDKHLSLKEIFIRKNNPEEIKKAHGKYFTDLFLFEEEEGDYAGVDWIAASWFNRNLRIFRNLQRISVPGEKIISIYGSGHLGLLSQFVEDSENHILISPLLYLVDDQEKID